MARRPSAAGSSTCRPRPRRLRWSCCGWRRTFVCPATPCVAKSVPPHSPITMTAGHPNRWPDMIVEQYMGGLFMMRSGMFHWLAGAAVAIALASPANAQKKYDTGASDTEIKIGQTVPFSGPASAYAGIGKTQAAYFKMINEQGGINGRKLNLIQYDDAYSPPKAVEQVRKLVEGDEVLFTFQIIGTPSNAAVQKYLNNKKVPQLLAATGASRFTDPQNAPWTIGFNPNYQTEGRIYAKYILTNYPNAKIGILYQNDDLGRDDLAGLKTRPGDQAATMIVAEASYETSDPTVDSQIVKLKTVGADLVFDASTPKFVAQAIKKIADLGWKPVHILHLHQISAGSGCTPSPSTRLRSAP